LAIARADVIVQNGGGYDDFVGEMRAAAGATGTLIDAVRVSAVRAEAGEVNEHVWYDFPAVGRIAGRIADVLAEKDAGQAATFRANLRTFAARLGELERRTANLKARYAGEGVAITEPVPLYLLDAAGW
jgi:zinc/manganese transport system substrate-binding protein